MKDRAHQLPWPQDVTCPWPSQIPGSSGKGGLNAAQEVDAVGARDSRVDSVLVRGWVLTSYEPVDDHSEGRRIFQAGLQRGLAEGGR